MPKPFQYNAGSLIYCKGEEADKVFILQSGILNLIYTDIESGADIRTQVQPGEFFGVKSALGRFPREENAITQEDSTIMAFTVPEFEELAMSNTRIIFKMLKVFSRQLRRIHAHVFKLLETEEVKPDKGLFTIGERYLKNKRYDYAEYVFSRYLEHYPTGEKADLAAKNLKVAVSGLAIASAEGKKTVRGAAPKAVSSQKHPAGSVSAIVEKTYYDAVSLISQQKYDEAIRAFNHIVVENKDPEWTIKSAYEAGHCLFLLDRFEDCIKYYTKFIANYPEYPDIRDSMFYIGQSYEKIDNKDTAVVWYKKVITLSGEEKDGTRSKAMKAYQALGKE